VGIVSIHDFTDDELGALYAAESHVAAAWRTRAALRSLTDEQLDGIVELGLDKVGWARVRDELDERAERGAA